MYVNDISSSVACELYLYADNSALFATGNDVEELERILERELSTVSQWLIDKLSLHLGEKESVIYGSKNKVKSTRDIHEHKRQ